MLNEKVILVVDDDPTLLGMYVERAKAEGAIVIEARNGEEALTQAMQNHPHLILLDIMMPKINGLDVLKELKSEDDTKNIPVIILTALADPQKHALGMQLGASDYIIKSETMPMDVIEKIKRLIK